jgi:hypothetical protein
MTYVHQRSERWWIIHNLMRHMQLSHATRWCEPGAGGCGCLGCANNSGGLARVGITREEWREYMAEQLAQFAPTVADTAENS